MSDRRVVTAAKAAVRRGLGWGIAREMARLIAALRGRSLALVYHRLDREPDPPGVVPTISADLFARHLEALASVGEIVDLECLREDVGPRSRPRFALTFDDDFRSHREHVLPELVDSGVRGTFFLSGRALHGLGPYWFEILEELVASDGAVATARRLGVDADDLAELVAACETDAEARDRITAQGGETLARHLSAADIRALAGAGMTIGFHTVDHPALVGLDDHALGLALHRGRSELEQVADRSLRCFAYPHGKADPRVARAVAAAGFTTAWTGRPSPVRRGVDAMRLGRWEPGAIGVDQLLVELAIRLNASGDGA
jgi:peptidoglycan/xylan/chitin deacetylase (PgdA/CDA1 family)